MPRLAAVILVGGQARRLLGQNKCDLQIGPKSCLQWTLDVFEGQVDKIALSVGKTDRYHHAKNHEIIYDWPSPPERRGVALAVLGSLAWAKAAGYDAVITAPVDTPFLPKTYTTKLIETYAGLTPVVCKTAKVLHGLHAMWPVSCFDRMKQAVLEEDILKISKLHAILKSTELSFADETVASFMNINDEDVLQKARQTFKHEK